MTAGWRSDLGLIRFALAILIAAVLGQALLQQPPADGRRLPPGPMQLAREAHDLYREQQWAPAAEKYEAAIALRPDLVGAYFYLGNCYDNLDQLGRDDDAASDTFITKAVRNYTIAADRDPDPKMRKLALEYLAAAYAPHRLNDPVRADLILRRVAEMGRSTTPLPNLVDGVVPLYSGATGIRKTKHVEPVIPERALRAKVEGIVIIEVIIDKQGRVRHARVLRSVPLLDEAALAAVRQWEFTPATYNGEPWPVYMTVTVALKR